MIPWAPEVWSPVVPDQYQCCECVAVLGLQGFGEETEHFREALARAIDSERRRPHRAWGEEALYIRRAFIRKLREVRDEGPGEGTIPAHLRTRFDREADEVRGQLFEYAMSTDRGLGWDPLRWELTLGDPLPQTRDFVLTLASLFVAKQDEALAEDKPIRTRAHEAGL